MENTAHNVLLTEPTANFAARRAAFDTDFADTEKRLAADHEPFIIDSADRADWLLGKLAAIDAERERISANTAKRIAELQTDRDGLLHRFGAQLETFARIEAERRRRKTVTLANGTIAFRTVPARLTFADIDKATDSAPTVCPDAVETETVTMTRFNKIAYIAAAQAALDTTGELLPGVELIAASEAVSIKPGAKPGRDTDE